MSDYWETRQDNNVTNDGRTAFERDYARVVHSAAFRRLQAKTQVLGIGDSDFYRTRLTHSLEVSQIGEGIVRQLARACDTQKGPYSGILLDPFLIRTICLAHDLGHPPFGHGGEVALNRCMLDHGGFEGNGQTLRIMTRIEPYHATMGMNLSRRSLLGVLKYPAPYSAVVVDSAYPKKKIRSTSVFKAQLFTPPKCYLDTENDVVTWLGRELDDWRRVNTEFKENTPGKHRKTKHKSLDASIMDLADDIAYGVHDLEDAIGLSLIDRAKFTDAVSPKELEPFCMWPDGLKYIDFVNGLFSTQTYKRKKSIGALVDFFIRHSSLDTSNPHGFSHQIFGHQVVMSDATRMALDAIKNVVKNEVILSTNVQQLEFKGQKIVTELFYAFATDPTRLLPNKDKERWKSMDGDSTRQYRIICDHIAGMTDEYATKRYQHLFAPRVGSVFDKL